MAAPGVAVAQFTTKTKIAVGNGRAKYVGVVAFGSEYETGGDTIESNPEARHALPAQIDSVQISGTGGWDFSYEGGKIKAYGTGAAAKGAGAEASAKTSLSAIKATFEIIGCE